MRRFTSHLPRKTIAVINSNASVNTSLPLVSTRNYVSIFCVVGSLFNLACCMFAWGACFNNVANNMKFGLDRMGREIDGKPIEDFPVARLLGCAWGLYFWWGVVGEKKWVISDMDRFQPKWGPF